MESLFVHTEPRKLLQIGLLCLGLLALPGSAAHAQPAAQPTEEEIAAARALFAEGLQLSDASEWEAAAAIFHEVLAVVSTPPVLFNLAHALVELNQFDEADELIERLMADSETTRDLRTRSTALRTRMDRNGGRLTIQPSGLPEGSVVLLDGRPLAATSLGTALRVSQGTHRVTATDAGQEIASLEIYVARRTRETVQVTPDQALVAANAARAQEAAANAARAAQEAQSARAAADAELAELQRLHAEWETERRAGRVPDGENPFEVRRAELERERAEAMEAERRALEAAEHTPREQVPLRRNWRFWTVVGSVAALAIGVGVAVAVTNDSQPNQGVLGNFSPGRVEF